MLERCYHATLRNVMCPSTTGANQFHHRAAFPHLSVPVPEKMWELSHRLLNHAARVEVRSARRAYQRDVGRAESQSPMALLPIAWD
jgi:hypothetical protein